MFKLHYLIMNYFDEMFKKIDSELTSRIIEGELAKAEVRVLNLIIYCLVDRLGGEITISDEQLIKAGKIESTRDDYDTGIIIKIKK
jgi:hypothetical protein